MRSSELTMSRRRFLLQSAKVAVAVAAVELIPEAVWDALAAQGPKRLLVPGGCINPTIVLNQWREVRMAFTATEMKQLLAEQNNWLHASAENFARGIDEHLTRMLTEMRRDMLPPMFAEAASVLERDAVPGTLTKPVVTTVYVATQRLSVVSVGARSMRATDPEAARKVSPTDFDPHIKSWHAEVAGLPRGGAHAT